MEAVNYAFKIRESDTIDNGFVKYEFHYQLHDRIQWGNMLCVVLACVFTWLLRRQYSLEYISQAHMSKDDESFKMALKVKLNVLESIIRGKRVILIDDSIIKGMTAKHIIGLLRKAGATEVHLRISSPPVFNTCYFGTTINDRGSLITNSMKVEQICAAVGADSLGFVSVDGIHNVAGLGEIGICDACFRQ